MHIKPFITIAYLIMLLSPITANADSTITFTRQGQPTMNLCSDFRQITRFDNREYTSTGKACRISVQNWELFQDEGAIHYEARHAFRPHMIFTSHPPDLAKGTCQTFMQTTFIGVNAQNSSGKACYQPDGTWLIQKTGARTVSYRHAQGRIYLMPLLNDFQLPHEFYHRPARK